jgi:vacuolar-type H+-ATPase subunit E/Vma4
MEATMASMDHIAKLEEMLSSGRVPGTARTLVNLEKVGEVLTELKRELPSQVNDAQTVLRQKEAILKQAELEARRIRAYADEEATTIRSLAEEQSQSQIATATSEAQEMLSDSEIVKAAEERAREIEAAAEERANKIISEAQGKLNQVLAGAEKDAADRRRGADNYAREVLFMLEEKIADTLGQVRSGIDVLDAQNLAVGD